MLSSRLVRLARLDRLRPDPGVSHRALAFTFSARFVDEVTSGAWLVLIPTFRRVFRLTLLQVGLLTQVLTWVALLVEPVTASLIDVTSRRRLMVFGAAMLGLSMLLMASGASYAVLLVGFGLAGVGGGPLAHTADVAVVESFPDAPERAFARATFFDTTGAMLGPALIAAAAVLHVSWRAVLLGLGVGCAVYAFGIARTCFPAPRGRRDPGWRLIAQALGAARSALARPPVRRAVIVLWYFDLFEAAFVLKYVWLHDSVGLSEGAVALWGAAEQLVDLAALLALDRWLRSTRSTVLLRVASAALVALPMAWVLAPGVWGHILLGVPLALAHALVWPLAKSRSLVAAPELAGSVQAITTLFPVLPLPLLEAWLSQAVGVGTAMALTAAVGAAAMFAACSGGDDVR